LLGLELFPERVRDKQDLWYYRRTGNSAFAVPPLMFRKVRTSLGLPTHVHQKRLGNVHRRNFKDTDQESTDQSPSIMDQRNIYWFIPAQSHIDVDRPFTDLYDTEGTGGFPGITFINRPVVGGHFALLALGKAKELRKGKNLQTGTGQLPIHWIG